MLDFKVFFLFYLVTIRMNAQNMNLLALPDADASSSEYQKLELNGNSIKLDDMGPIIINTDGTTRKISNWNILSSHEKEATLRRISKRNKERLLKLKEQNNDTNNTNNTNDTKDDEEEVKKEMR